jgi:hypothetical protein
MTCQLTFKPPVAVSTDHRPASAACTGAGCRWSESEPTGSADLQDPLLSHAREHAQDCGNPVTITVKSVLTIVPLPRRGDD